MENIIRHLFRENKENPEYSHLNNSRQPYAFSRMERLEEALRLKIPRESHTILDSYQDAIMELLEAASEDNYVLGYQLGVLMMVAAWPDAKNRQ